MAHEDENAEDEEERFPIIPQKGRPFFGNLALP